MYKRECCTIRVLSKRKEENMEVRSDSSTTIYHLSKGIFKSSNVPK